jgi:serine/threonine protein kinase
LHIEKRFACRQMWPLAGLLLLLLIHSAGGAEPQNKDTYSEAFDETSTGISEAQTRYPELTLLGAQTPETLLASNAGHLVIRLAPNQPSTSFTFNLVGNFPSRVLAAERVDIKAEVAIPSGARANDHAVGLLVGESMFKFRPEIPGGGLYCEGCPTSVLMPPLNMSYDPVAGVFYTFSVSINFAHIPGPRVVLRVTNTQDAREEFKLNYTDPSLNLTASFYVGPVLVTGPGTGGELWCDALQVDVYTPINSGGSTSGVVGSTTSDPTTSFPSTGSYTTGLGARAATTGDAAAGSTTGSDFPTSGSSTSTTSGSAPPPTTSTLVGSTSAASRGGVALVVVILVVVGVSLLLLVCVVAAVAFYRRRRASSTSSKMSDGYDTSSAEQSFRMAHAATEYQNLLRGVSVGEQIGEGAFGKVYKATREGAVVAVKQIQEQAEQDALVKELDVMLRLDSPRVVTLFGVCLLNPKEVDGGGLGLVMEFCEHGSLASHLRGKAGRSLMRPALVQLALHVAEGLAYLHSLSVLHRDLAARNVLVASDGSAKLAEYVCLVCWIVVCFASCVLLCFPRPSKGAFVRWVCPVALTRLRSRPSFGLARIVAKGGEYVATSKLPVRWASPEVLRDKRFTTASDCYALAITLFEIFSRGEKPLRDLDNLAVIDAVLSDGTRPPIPHRCPSRVAKLMERLWLEEASERPSADTAAQELAVALESALVGTPTPNRVLYDLIPGPISPDDYQEC